MFPFNIPLDPDVNKSDCFVSFNKDDSPRIELFEENRNYDDLKNTYFLHEIGEAVIRIEDLIKTFLAQLLESQNQEEKISYNVYNSSCQALNWLYPSILESISEADIASTTYGTVIIDWEKENDVFSLEIGAVSLGYFIEVGGKDEKQVDEINLDDDSTRVQLLEDLVRFLD